ncbi:MinD/ParA family protein [Candidatus Latescibacterota bacterium]
MRDEFEISDSTQDIIYILQETTDRKVWTFAGGKGGTGKTAMTANIGVAMATMGYRIIVVDADLGGANLHTILNIKRPKLTLTDFINRRVNNLNDILLSTPSENLRLISGGSDMVGLANIPFQSKLRLQRHLEQLEADYILIDLGAGSNFNTLDFFIMSNEGFVVCNPEPTAKINAYSFLKSVVYRIIEREFKRGTRIYDLIIKEGKNNKSGSLAIPELIKRIHSVDMESAERIRDLLTQFRPKFILNRLRRFNQEREGLQFAGLTEKYLGVSLEYLGMVRDDSHVVDSSELMMPFVLQFPGCGASKDVYNLVSKLKIEDKLGRFNLNRSNKLKKYIKTESRYWSH